MLQCACKNCNVAPLCFPVHFCLAFVKHFVPVHRKVSSLMDAFDDVKGPRRGGKPVGHLQQVDLEEA
jgi:hypothetical protein